MKAPESMRAQNAENAYSKSMCTSMGEIGSERARERERERERERWRT